MMRARFLIREINGSRSPWMVQRRAGSIATSIEQHSETNDLQNARSVNDIPGPKALPVLGNWFRFIPYIGEYGNVNLITRLRMLREQYGNIVKLDGLLSSRPSVLLFSPELCEKMYRNEGTWPTRQTMESMHYYRTSRKDIYGELYGLPTSQGKMWHDFRSKVNPFMMQPRTVQAHIGQISEVTSDFVERMRALRDPKTQELPDYFLNEIYKWSLESICLIAMNCRLGCLRPNLAADSEQQIMINCAHSMHDLMYRLDVLPSLWKMYNTRNLRKFFRVIDTLNEIIGKHIERAETKLRKTTDGTDTQGHSVLEKLLRIDKQTAHVMALDMLTGGVDTTGNAASSLLYYIATNSEKQERLREEVMSVLPDKTSPVTHNVLNQTKYAKACIKESLRLLPIAVGTLRTLQTDVCLGGYRIPEGFDILAIHSLLSLDPTQFSQPEEYIPERWLRGNTEFPSAKEAHPFAYMPFGFGPRTCIGRRFFEMEVETLVLTVIRNFRIEWHHGPLEYESRFINTVSTPLRLKLVDL